MPFSRCSISGASGITSGSSVVPSSPPTCIGVLQSSRSIRSRHFPSAILPSGPSDDPPARQPRVSPGRRAFERDNRDFQSGQRSFVRYNREFRSADDPSGPAVSTFAFSEKPDTTQRRMKEQNRNVHVGKFLAHYKHLPFPPSETIGIARAAHSQRRRGGCRSPLGIFRKVRAVV